MRLLLPGPSQLESALCMTKVMASHRCSAAMICPAMVCRMTLRNSILVLCLCALFTHSRGQSVADAARASKTQHKTTKYFTNEDEPPKAPPQPEKFKLKRTPQDAKWDALLPEIQELTAKFCADGHLAPHGQEPSLVSSRLMEQWGRLRLIISYDEDKLDCTDLATRPVIGCERFAPLVANLTPAQREHREAVLKATRERVDARTAALKELTDSCGFPYPRG